jgi:hypothetical protein
MTGLAASCSKALMIITAIYLGFLILGFGLCFLEGPDSAGEMYMIIYGVFALSARVCWFVTVPIVFHRVNEAYAYAVHNINVLDTQETFS